MSYTELSPCRNKIQGMLSFRSNVFMLDIIQVELKSYAQLKPESTQKFTNAEMYKTYSMYEKSAETIKQLVPTKEEAAKLAAKLDDILKGKAAAGDAERVLIDSVANMNDAYLAAFKAGGLVTNKGIGASAAGSAMAGRSDSK